MGISLPQPTSADTAILDRLEKILQHDGGNEISLLYDDVGERFYADWHHGQTLREALLKLVTEGDHA